MTFPYLRISLLVHPPVPEDRSRKENAEEDNPDIQKDGKHDVQMAVLNVLGTSVAGNAIGAIPTSAGFLEMYKLVES